MSGGGWFLAAGHVGLETVLQVLFLVALAPFVGWCLDALPGWIGGRSVVGPSWRYRQALALWRTVCGVPASRAPLPPVAALALTMALLGFLGLPAVTTFSALSGLSDPLLVGLVLLAGRVFVGHGAGSRDVARLGPAVLLLCLAEALIALSAPGSDGLAGLSAMLHIEPMPGLVGALAACALSLGIVCPPVAPTEVTAMLAGTGDREVRDAARCIVDLLNCGWLLLLSDFAFPGVAALAGTGFSGWCVGACAFLGRLGVVIAVAVGLRLTAQERSARLTTLFAGLALLLALAGRFGA